jgi:hypothetical protein
MRPYRVDISTYRGGETSPPDRSDFVAVASGDTHTCGLTSSGM